MMHKVISQYSKPDPDICLDFLLKLVEFAGSQIRRGQILVPKSWIVDSDQKMLRILRPKQKRHPLNSSCHLRSIYCHLCFHSAPPSLRRVYNWQNRTPYVAWKYHSWLNFQNHLIQLYVPWCPLSFGDDNEETCLVLLCACPALRRNQRGGGLISPCHNDNDMICKNGNRNDSYIRVCKIRGKDSEQ